MNLLKNLALVFLLAAFLLAAESASAEEGGGKDTQHAALEPITVNLQGSTRQYLQVEMTLRLAKPELIDKIKLYMPVIRHTMILLLTSKEANQLTPLDGKMKLVQESKNALNRALGLTEKDGITDVLFTALIIQ